MTSKIFMYNGIKNLLRTNYNIVTDLIDLESEIDSSLTYSENWNNIKEKYITNKDYSKLQIWCCDRLMKLEWIYCPFCAKDIMENYEGI